MSTSITSTERMTLNHMKSESFTDSKPEPTTISKSRLPSPPGDEVFRRVTNPRVQFIKLTTFAKNDRGIPGKPYPFCPQGPSLARELYPEAQDEAPAYRRKRSTSPLQHIALSAYSRRQVQRYNCHFRSNLPPLTYAECHTLQPCQTQAFRHWSYAVPVSDCPPSRTSQKTFPKP